MLDTAITRIRTASEMSLHYYGKPLLVLYSGGKDSDTVLQLVRTAGVPFEVLHNHTTVDAPETVRHIRDTFRKLELDCVTATIERPALLMWRLIEKNGMPPTRKVRYCCAELKERGGAGRYVVSGIRRAESVKRKKRGLYETITPQIGNKIVINNDNDDTRRLTEHCALQGKTMLNPIIDWSDRDVWDYLRDERITLNPIYECGYNRVGCIGCPMGRKRRYVEFARYPKYRAAYVHAFDKMLERNRERGKPHTTWRNGEDVMAWWLGEDINQLTFDL